MKALDIPCLSAPRLAFAGLLLTALLVSACGGSDKKALPVPQPAAPSVTVASSGAKTLQFSWAAVSYANHYRLLKNESGTSGYTTVVENVTATSVKDEIAVHLHDWVNTRYIVEACNQTGCTASTPVFTTNAMLGAIGTLRVTNPKASDYLGYNLALSGDGKYLAVGATNRDFTVLCEGELDCVLPVDNAGSVVVFRRQDGVWTQEAELDVVVSAANDTNYFGYALTFSENGDTLAVGTPFEASAAQGIDGERDDASALDAGAVYVFVRNGTNWQEQAYIKASNAEAHDYFGSSLQLSANGNLLFVGAPGEASNAVGINGNQNDNSVGISGAVYIFERENSLWEQTTYLKVPQNAYKTYPCFNPSPVRCLPTQGGRFGSSLAITPDASTLVVGAIYDHSNATGVGGTINNLDGERSGAVHVYGKTEAGWTHQSYIKSSNSRIRDNFAHRVVVSADGNTLAVSSIKERSQATGVNGDASDISATDAGAVYLFERNAGNWTQTAYVKASNTSAHAEFGSSLALSADGDWLAVGSPREKSNAAGIGGIELNDSLISAGAAYLFKRDGNTWAQHRYIKAPTAATNASFGFSLALDNAGTTLAVGAMGTAAPQEGATALVSAGAVHLY